MSLIITSSVSKEINVEKIFEKFYQEDHSRKSKGIGLGLYICKKFMEDMNGRISAENKDGMFVIKIELEHF